MRKIGIIGCYSHDVILLLAKTIRCLGKRVVITDRNEAHILSACVPFSENRKQGEYMEYNGIIFSDGDRKGNTSDAYDVEFIDFGFVPQSTECVTCSELLVICDMHMHHMQRIRDATFPREKVKICILRDVVPELLNREKSVEEFLVGVAAKKQIYLWPDGRDIKNRYVCELQYEYNMKNASAQMRTVIFEAISVLFPGTNERELRRKIRQEERREYH